MSEEGRSRDEAEDQDSDLPQINIPGQRRLREVVTNFASRALPGKGGFRREAMAGLTVTAANVPQAMANGLLVGVNPIYGLYANMVGPVVGGFTSSIRLMVVNSTSAAALVAGQALVGIPADNRDGALFLMVMLAGIFAIGLGLLGLGRLTRFVSFSVMTGFIAGMSVVLILGQLPTVIGVDVEGGNSVAEFFDLVASLGSIHVPTLMVGALSVALAVLLPRTPLGNAGTLLAIAVPTLITVWGGMEGVETVSDVGEISGGFPMPYIPSFSDISVEALTGALSVAAIVLVQGAGVGQSVPNQNGGRDNSSQDFMAQGAANVAAGIFRGLPVGGSLSGTALNVMGGASGRLAGMMSGVWTAVIVIGFPALISRVIMPALAALLLLTAFNMIDVSDIRAVIRAGWPSRLASATTFLSTLFLPIQAAVGFGVVLSALLYVNESSTDVTVVRLVERSDGRIEERDCPDQLEGDTIFVLDVYGHLFFAGARTLQRILPEVPEGIQHPVVLLRLRGQSTLGATLVDVLTDYAERLEAVEGRLYVTGVGGQALEHLKKTGRFNSTGSVRAYEATPVVLEATRAAYADAEGWLVEVHESDQTNNGD